MITGYRSLLILGLLAVSLSAIGTVSADMITIPEASFEAPDLSVGTPYTSAPDGSDMLPWIGSAASIYNVAGYYGPYGEGNVTNPDGAQCGYLANQVGQRPYLYQTLADTYTAGSDYTLTLGAALYQGGAVAIDPAQMMTMQLGYWTGAADGNIGPTILAERQLTLADLLEGTLTDFSISTGAISGDAVGQPIVVYFARAAGAPSGRQYSIDNVRLNATAIPEPGTVVLLLSGLIGLVVCTRRKRK